MSDQEIASILAYVEKRERDYLDQLWAEEGKALRELGVL